MNVVEPAKAAVPIVVAVMADVDTTTVVEFVTVTTKDAFQPEGAKL